MHHCQEPKDKVDTRTNEFNLCVSKLRSKIVKMFLITRGTRVWKNSCLMKELKKPPDSFKDQFMGKGPTGLPSVAQEWIWGPTRLY